MSLARAEAVKRAYRYRFYPTSVQVDELNRTFGYVRLVYNKALEERTRAWYGEQRRVTYVETSAMLTDWKKTKGLDFLPEVSSVPLQQALRHLQVAFTNFWAKRAGYPTFKSKRKSRPSAEYTWSAFRWKDGRLILATMSEPLAIAWFRPLPDGAEPSTVIVSRDPAGRWHVSILAETVVSELPPVDAQVGVDAGLAALLTFSDGEKVSNPRHERRDRVMLARAQREPSRKEKGSKNRAKARVKVARIHARIADRRRDGLHKVTTRLVRENQTIVIEDLAVRNMIRNHGLARAISDAAWGELRRMLEYKVGWYGRDLVVIDRFFPSSQTCSACGKIDGPKPLDVREWTCRQCGVRHDRDVNAAKMIPAAGLAVAACGDGVRPDQR
ncbi:RNA-guided endonuclease TnpB family protein [Frankia sp. QA3]|uniref:RNA-guided endonuclease InsQ/TnpB family protein n=1 Tax=Frankia sp. QA3 TaxID=710111 RepID=UPI000269B8A3|nr:RNA-guided endonuclease TnpB family protein [Frankia sp. QA3]EIV90800.1 transposase, IS605 OrfB family, central region [Frankia sp. QA3]